jgi:hypothetical protein
MSEVDGIVFTQEVFGPRRIDPMTGLLQRADEKIVVRGVIKIEIHDGLLEA